MSTFLRWAVRSPAVTGVSNTPWVYQQALGRARSDPVRYALITIALNGLRWMNEAGRASALVRQEAAMSLREQERMKNCVEQSQAEARARDVQLEENTERKIQEAVEAERRSARALSEERRRLHNENFERAIRFEFREDVKQLKAAAVGSLTEVKQLEAAALEGLAKTRAAVIARK